jgi:hypothetical protein
MRGSVEEIAIFLDVPAQVQKKGNGAGSFSNGFTSRRILSNATDFDFLFGLGLDKVSKCVRLGRCRQGAYCLISPVEAGLSHGEPAFIPCAVSFCKSMA